jgi:site-specific recombinase XerD
MKTRTSLAEAVQSFITARNADGRAPRTIKDYHRVLQPFSNWCNEHGYGALAALNSDAVYGYVAALRSRGWAAATIAIHIRNLRSFLSWLWYTKLLADNLAAEIHPPRVASRLPDLPTPEEIAALLASCNPDDPLGARDRAIMLVLLDTGMRVGELCALQCSDVHTNGDTALLSIYAPKTYSWRDAFLGALATSAVKAYMAIKHNNGRSEFFLSRCGTPLCQNTVWKMLKRRAALSGVNPNKLYPHIFRKLFATHWIENGGDEIRLMFLGGWASQAMLRVYVALAGRKKLATGHQKYGPVDNIPGLRAVGHHL